MREPTAPTAAPGALDAAARATMASFPPFVERVDPAFRRTNDTLDVLQVNIGLRCNLACAHCHYACSPKRTEAMSRETMQHCLDVFAARGFKTLDITGGAPEMNPDFEWFIREAARVGAPMIVRSNLVILHEPVYAHLPEVYAELGANVVASLPHYTRKTMEKQRGGGTFDKVISMLQRLCELGYGHGGGLKLDLVYNPTGAFMPPDQEALRKEYARKLEHDFGIVFDDLFAFTNNPIGRFGNALERKGALGKYVGKLVDAFNPETVEAMMCRNQVSVAWDGRLYDCDFNQAAGLPCRGRPTISDLLDPETPLARDIVFGTHCYACTAGAGSS